MTDLQIYLAMIAKMAWLWLPVILLLAFWGLYELIEQKWDKRYEKCK